MQAGERLLNTGPGDAASARVCLAVEPHWIGRSVTGENGPAGDLREAIVAAQREVLHLMQLPGTAFRVLKLHWESEDRDGTGWIWNPQIPIPTDTELLICVGECQYAC